MNIHQALTCLIYAVVVLMICLGLWLAADANQRLDQTREARRNRRLDRRADREIRKQFQQIINAQDDGIEHP